MSGGFYFGNGTIEPIIFNSCSGSCWVWDCSPMLHGSEHLPTFSQNRPSSATHSGTMEHTGSKISKCPKSCKLSKSGNCLIEAHWYHGRYLSGIHHWVPRKMSDCAPSLRGPFQLQRTELAGRPRGPPDHPNIDRMVLRYVKRPRILGYGHQFQMG